MAEWREFRLWYATTPDPNTLFAFKKAYLSPILEKHGIEDFLMLDQREFILLRVEVENETAKQIKLFLEESIQPGSLFSRVTVETWSPIVDARNRILAARERAKVPAEVPEGGWMIKGKNSEGKWVVVPENLDNQIAAFSTFMARVVGRFTKAYLKEMPYRVEDRWLTSLFLHLILDSISIWQKEENESREFPYV